MKINFDAPILRIDGTEFAEKPSLKTVCFMAATNQLPGDDAMPVDEKLALYGLAQKAHAGGVQELVVEDVALLRKRIGKAFGVEVVGAAFALLG